MLISHTLKAKMGRVISKFRRSSRPPIPSETLHNAAPSGTANAPLENLPPELRHQVLATLTLDGLRDLVHASPVFYQQYLQDRTLLIRQCLRNTLGNVIIEAYAVHQSSAPTFATTRSQKQVSHLLESYQNMHRTKDYSIMKELSGSDAVEMATYYSSIIQPIARYYTHWALDNLDSKHRDSHTEESLSKTEETRLIRALYRFQLCCQLFGKGNYTGRFSIQKPGFGSPEILDQFLCLFEPWEIEEIICFSVFAQETCDQIFSQIQWDVNENNPKFDGQRPPTPDGAFHLGDDDFEKEYLLEGTVSGGLKFLYTVLFTIRDHAHLVSVMQNSITILGNSFILGSPVFDWHTIQQQVRHDRDYLSEPDRKQEARDPLPFEGDIETRPPLAWTVIWKGTFSNFYGYYMNDLGTSIRRWGYILWDAPRLQRLGAEDVLRRELEIHWDDYDPRDDWY